MIKYLITNHFVIMFESIANSFLNNFYFFNQPKKNELEHWRKRNVFLRLKTKLGLYHVVLTTSESSYTKIALTIVEMHQLPELEQ